MSRQYTRPGSNTVPIAVNDVVLITTPEGSNHPADCGCGACSGSGGVATGTQGTQGLTGAQGVQGTTGIQGPTGNANADLTTTDDLTEGTTNKYFTVGRVSYEHIQDEVSKDWVIVHNLGFKPNVTVIDSAGTIYEGEIAYTNTNSLTVSFSAAFSGKAFLS